MMCERVVCDGEKSGGEFCGQRHVHGQFGVVLCFNAPSRARECGAPVHWLAYLWQGRSAVVQHREMVRCSVVASARYELLS